MKPLRAFSLARTFAMFLKEVVQMRRDRLTFGMMLGVPLMQLLLFGFAIDTDPRHLPTVIERREDGPLTRSFIASLEASTYFDLVAVTTRPGEAEEMLRQGRASFAVAIPEGFETRLVRGERPQLLVSADASDPVAAGGPLGALNEIASRAFAPHFEGALRALAPPRAPYEIVTHRLFNPAGVTAFNIVPALLGVILTMTMTMITSIALTREVERGTMETLLATPVRPLEIMLGKTTPYVFVGMVQTLVVLGAARVIFHIPFTGSGLAFAVAVALFLAANLMLGYLISTLARTQMQAMQMTFFVFLPSILLSGFMFPFAAMPHWARWIGEVLPLTHFLRMVREVVLKGGDLASISPELVPLAVILAVLTGLALLRFRQRLD